MASPATNALVFVALLAAALQAAAARVPETQPEAGETASLAEQQPLVDGSSKQSAPDQLLALAADHDESARILGRRRSSSRRRTPRRRGSAPSRRRTPRRRGGRPEHVSSSGSSRRRTPRRRGGAGGRRRSGGGAGERRRRAAHHGTKEEIAKASASYLAACKGKSIGDSCCVFTNCVYKGKCTTMTSGDNKGKVACKKPTSEEPIIKACIGKKNSAACVVEKKSGPHSTAKVPGVCTPSRSPTNPTMYCKPAGFR